MALNITDLKKGTLIEWEGSPFKVVDYNQKVMGRGGSIVNVRIKGLVDGKVLDKTFKGSDQLEGADVSTRTAQYLYKDDQFFHFMNETSFEQFEVAARFLDGAENYLKEGDRVQLQFFKDQAIAVELPKNVALSVTYTENAIKGDTSSAINKNATVETGLVVKVPAFIKQGDIISIDTSSGVYRERLKG